MAEQLGLESRGADAEDGDVDDLDEVAEVLPTLFSITSYGADFPVDGLVKRLGDGDIVIPIFARDPESGQSVVNFQRDFVWNKIQADRFIESLLLGLPVPGIFLVREPNNKMMVLDGQQRLQTLQSFYQGVFRGKEFSLTNAQNPWKGKTYRTLAPDDRRRLDNSIIHATVVRQDEPSEDQSSIYLIFERLNSGGTILKPQEIRVALYHGRFASLLRELNENADWRALYGNRSSRLKDIELILRFFALLLFRDAYSRPMKGFLNLAMAKKRNIEDSEAPELRRTFEQTMSAIRKGIGEGAFRPKRNVNAAVLDSVSVGVAVRLKDGPIATLSALKEAYERLLADPKYDAAIARSTADEESVKTRLLASINAFASVK